jgi:A/G-specific adenine glycosylase
MLAHDAVTSDAASLLAWYAKNRRSLPWRAVPGQSADPYHVWLSEIMLQQTTVVTCIPYFTRFLQRFPTLHDLAAASSDAVMRAWAGLGYYARARNLHNCAKIVSLSGGDFPRDVAALEALPGIGPYTARALAAIAFGLPVVPVDGNVERVIARRFAITTALPAAKPEILAALEKLAAARAARLAPSDFAQSLFDLGAGPCGRVPDCAACPWQKTCLARAQNIAAELPRKLAKKPRPARFGAAFWLADGAGNVLLRRRPPRGLLGGMMEFPGTEWGAKPVARAALLAQAPVTASWREAGRVAHVFTHFTLHLTVFAAQSDRLVLDDALDAGWHPIATLDGAALPSLMRKCAAAVGGGGQGLLELDR